MLKNMLAKMASKLGKSEDEMDEMDEMEVDSMEQDESEDDKDKRFKSGAIVAEFRPKLQEALRKKDPAKYDEFIQTVASKRKEGADLIKQGKIEEGKKKMMEANQYAQEADLETYLEPDEVKKVLGSDYGIYMKAVMDVMREPGQYPVKRITGEKEKGQVETVSDVRFGRRLATMPISVGYESSEGKGTFYKYNPKTGAVEIDKERTR